MADLQTRLSLLISAIGVDIHNLSAATTDVSIGTAHPPGYAIQNFHSITAQAVALTLGTTTGTEIEGNKLVVRIKDNGTPQTIAYAVTPSQYRTLDATNMPLPTITVAGKWLYLGFVYNGTDAIWDLVSILRQT